VSHAPSASGELGAGSKYRLGYFAGSGLSAVTIKRMLASAQLPPPARKIISEYVEQKLAGAYGHNKTQLRKFRERLGANGFWADTSVPRPRSAQVNIGAARAN